MCVCMCQGDGRGDEQIKCECDREVLGVGEGEEGIVGEVGVKVRDPMPEAEGATADAAIKHVCTASGGGGGAVIEREEAKGCNHCRGGPLGMWVESYIQAVQVKEIGRRVSKVVIKLASSGLAKGDGGRGEAAIVKAGVQVREASISREQVSMARLEGDGAVGSGQPVPGLSHMPLVWEHVLGAAVCELAAMQGGDPCAHVVPDSGKRAVEGGVVIGGLAMHSNVGHAAVASEAASQGAGRGRVCQLHSLYTRLRTSGSRRAHLVGPSE